MREVPVSRKLSTIEEWCQGKIFLFGEDITGTEVTNPKTVLGPSPGEDVGFRDHFYPVTFNDTYRMITPMESFRAKKDGQKM
jgi:hypothetical protein